jgi:hypothetical protein
MITVENSKSKEEVCEMIKYISELMHFHFDRNEFVKRFDSYLIKNIESIKRLPQELGYKIYDEIKENGLTYLFKGVIKSTSVLFKFTKEELEFIYLGISYALNIGEK